MKELRKVNVQDFSFSIYKELKLIAEKKADIPSY